MLHRVFFIAVVLIALPSYAAAQQQPALIAVEARMSQGIAFGGGPGTSTMRLSPFDLGAMVDYAVRTQPWTTAYGGAFLESYGRAGFGVRGGVRLAKDGGMTRLGLGAVALVRPYTAGGIEVGLGRCWRFTLGASGCADFEMTALVLGSDVPDGRIAAQAQLAVGIRFDAW